MNMVELQLDFYRRFNEAAAKLTFARGQLLCTLLGHTGIPCSKSLTCGLSMGVTAAARRLDGGIIKLESTKDNVCTIYRINNIYPSETGYIKDLLSLFEKSGFRGAEILFDSDITPCFSDTAPLRVAVYRAIMNISAYPENDIYTAASICAGENDRPIYLASLAAKKGWCTYMQSNNIAHYPLPLTGFCIITAQTRRRGRINYLKRVEKDLRSLRRVYPSVRGFGDVSADMLSGGSYPCLNYLFTEQKRVDEACAALKKCRLEDFAEIVRRSEIDIERYLRPEQEHIFLARQLQASEGCICARLWQKGAYAIVEDALADYVIKRAQTAFEAYFGTKAMFSVCGCDGK